MVNWNGDVGTEFVEWGTLKALGDFEGVYSAVASPTLSGGASGGGYYWNGQHFANHWGRRDFAGQPAAMGAVNPLTVAETQ